MMPEAGGQSMAEEKDAFASEEKTEQPKSGKKNLLIVIVIVVLALALAGAGFAYLQFFKAKPGAVENRKEEKKETKSALIAIDPFVLNLAEQGRFLKVSMQFEIADATQQQSVNEKMPQLRDAIITLVSSKSAEAVSSPEGKFQLKDEILLRANQAMGKGVVFRNLYFTEFVMQ
jgi:flagellar FliL protein